MVEMTRLKSQKFSHKQSHCRNHQAVLNEKPTDSPQWFFIGSSIQQFIVDRTTLACNSWGIMQQLWAANIVEHKSVRVFTEPIEQKWYTVFILLFGVRRTFPKPVLPNPKETGRAQAEDLPVPAFMTSIQTRRLRWLGFMLVHHWLRNFSL